MSNYFTNYILNPVEALEMLVLIKIKCYTREKFVFVAVYIIPGDCQERGQNQIIIPRLEFGKNRRQLSFAQNIYLSIALPSSGTFLMFVVCGILYSQPGSILIISLNLQNTLYILYIYLSVYSIVISGAVQPEYIGAHLWFFF